MHFETVLASKSDVLGWFLSCFSATCWRHFAKHFSNIFKHFKIFSTFFTLYVTPSMYMAFAKNTKRIDAVDIELKKELSKK